MKTRMIEIGMSKEQVLRIMGKPQLREDDEHMEWWLYLTNQSEYDLYSGKYVPVVFKYGKLTGWGRNYWMKQQQLNVKTGQTAMQD